MRVGSDLLQSVLNGGVLPEEPIFKATLRMASKGLLVSDGGASPWFNSGRDSGNKNSYTAFEDWS